MGRKWLCLMFSLLPVLAAAADSNGDEEFFKSAAQGGLAEVAAGKLAENKAAKPALKDFAGMMVKDHSTADQKLWKIAGSQNVPLPKTPGVEQVAANERLKLLRDGSFDKAYAKNQIDAHRDLVALYKNEIAAGEDVQARQFAAATLPTLQSHLDKILKIAADLGVTAE
jgi:putative membrane protein